MSAGGRLVSAAWLLVGVCLLAVGCGGDEPDAGSTFVPRPGESLLRHLEHGRVTAYPDSNLDPEVAALLDGPVRVAAHVSPLMWERVILVPPGWEPLLAHHGQVKLWFASAPIPLLPDDEGDAGEPPYALLRGERLPEWNPFVADSVVPDEFACWYPPEGLMLAISDDVPRHVALVGRVAPETEFVRYERGAAVLGEQPRAEALALRAELEQVKRDALLLPAPGRLEFDLERLVAERLEVAVGLPPQAWSLQQGVVRRAGRPSDGVRVAVEVSWEETADDPVPVSGAVEDGDRRTLEVWRRELGPEAVGAAWVEADIDLSPWTGRAVTLRLLTDPGPSGDPLHDYALWSDLTLRGGAEAAPARPHVVFIDMDTLRADRLGAYGSPRAITPRLDAWTDAHAVVYEDAVSTAPWTLPSTVSMFTGLAVHQHDVDKAADALGPGSTTIATLLADAGYETRAIAGGGYLRPAYGCDLGFQVYETRDPKDLDWTAALDFVADRDSEQPFFLFLHSYAVHAPYEVNAEFVDPGYDGPLQGIVVDRDTVFEPWHECWMDLSAADAQYVEDLYDGLCVRMDTVVGGFLEELERLVDGQPLLVVFTSDHGEAFLEHGLFGHGLSLYDELLRVPLLVRYPDGEPGRSDRPASGVDILPTVLDVVGLPEPEGLAGRSLRDDDRGRDVRVAQSGTEERTVLSDGWKLIDPFERERPTEGVWMQLYERGVDPAEAHEVSSLHRARVEELRRRLEWYLNTHPVPESGGAVETAAGAAELAELRALGYLGG